MNNANERPSAAALGSRTARENFKRDGCGQIASPAAVAELRLGRRLEL